MPTGDDFNECMLTEHNNYRHLHGSPPLRINKELVAAAQRHAIEISLADHMKHTNGHYGENLYTMKASKHPSLKELAEMATQFWYSESQRHKFGTEPKDFCTSHFTQLIWADTSEMGAGHSESRSGNIYVVCNYKPAGNYLGKFAKNVHPAM